MQYVSLENELKNLQKKRVNLHKLDQQQTLILTKKADLETLKLTIEQLDVIVRLDRLINSVVNLTLNTEDLSLKELQDIFKKFEDLEKQFRVLKGTISKEFLDNEKEKIQSLETFFSTVDQLRKDQECIQEEIQQNLKDIISLDIVADTSQFFKGQKNFQETVCICVLQHLLNDEKITDLNSHALNEMSKSLLDTYLQVKNIFKNLDASEELEEVIHQQIQMLEAKLTNPQVQEYLKTYTLPTLNDLIFNASIFQSVESGEPASSVFTSKQQATLMRFTQIFQRGELVSPDDQNNLKTMLKSIEADQAFKEQINHWSEENSNEWILSYVPRFLHGLVHCFTNKDFLKKIEGPLPAGITKEAIDFLKTYLSNMDIFNKEKAKVQETNLKVEQLIKKYQIDPSSIQTQERLNLQQLGILSRFARLKEEKEEEDIFLQQAKGLNLLEIDENLKEFLQLNSQTKANLQTIENFILPTLDTYYQDGSIVAYVGKKKEQWLGKPISLEERVTMYAVNGFTHGAKLYHHEDGNIYISHLLGAVIQEPLSFYQLCISDIWDIDITPLIPSDLYDVLENVYGTEWSTIINQTYQNIEKNLHTLGEENFNFIKNSRERRLVAGFADHPFLFKMIGKKGVKSHERDYPRNFQEFNQKLMSGASLKKEQICSEFASKTTLASMIQLNNTLTEAIKTSLGDHLSGLKILQALQEKQVKISKSLEEYLQGIRHYKEGAVKTEKAEKELINLLKKNGYEDKTIQLIIRLGNKEIFDIPYNKRERLKAIHPGRMVQLLVDKQCAKLRPPPPAFTALIDLNQNN